MNTSQNNCSNQFPSGRTIYSEISDDKGITALTVVCGGLTVAIAVIYIEEVQFLLVKAKNNTGVRKSIFLLGLYLMIALMSLLILLFPVSMLIVEIATALYLAICVWLFIRLIISYMGGTENMEKIMAGENLSFATPPVCFVCRCCLKDCPFNRMTFRLACLFVLQMIFVRPFALTVPLILWTQQKYEPGDESDVGKGAFIANVISIASSLMCIWGLIVLFSGTRRKLKDFAIISKFASLQSVLVLYSLQLTVLMALAKTGVIQCSGTMGPMIRGIRIHHYLLILEMFIISLIARFAYRRHDPYSTYDSLQ